MDPHDIFVPSLHSNDDTLSFPPAPHSGNSNGVYNAYNRDHNYAEYNGLYVHTPTVDEDQPPPRPPLPSGGGGNRYHQYPEDLGHLV